MTRVFVSVGSNIERERHVPAALSALRERFGELQLSRVYESDALGFDGAPFYNLVVSFETDEAPELVADVLREVEAACGRRRGAERFASRTMDLDLLLYGDRVLRQPGLELPRPEILTDAFVLRPLAEIAGALLHPVLGRSYAELWEAFDDSAQHTAAVSFDPWGRARSPAGTAAP